KEVSVFGEVGVYGIHDQGLGHVFQVVAPFRAATNGVCDQQKGTTRVGVAAGGGEFDDVMDRFRVADFAERHEQIFRFGVQTDPLFFIAVATIIDVLLGQFEHAGGEVQLVSDNLDHVQCSCDAG